MVAASAALALHASWLPADEYEPDNQFDLSVDMPTPGQQDRDFSGGDSEDWVRFYAAKGYELYVIGRQTGTNVHLGLEVYRLNTYGGISLVASNQSAGVGTNNVEDAEAVVSIVESGYYLARFIRLNSGGGDAGTEYTIYLDYGGGLAAGSLLLSFVDGLNTNQPPPGSWVKRVFNGSTNWTEVGTNQQLAIKGLSAGYHLVSLVVAGAAGYWPAEDPFKPNQASNTNSLGYGNPRRIYVPNNDWATAAFQMTPYFAVTAVVTDAFTRERLSDAAIRFSTSTGVLAGFLHDRYPNFAIYATPWKTGSRGEFPTNLYLPAGSWDLELSKPGYVTSITVQAIGQQPPGTTNHLGAIPLSPRDANTNGIRDDWEALYFGGTTQPGLDADGDGVDNRGEYLAGTIPTNGASVLALSSVATGEVLQLEWPVIADRVYRVAAGASITGAWSTAFGPRTAAVNQAVMSYLVTNRVGAMESYRIEVLAP